MTGFYLSGAFLLSKLCLTVRVLSASLCSCLFLPICLSLRRGVVQGSSKRGGSHHGAVPRAAPPLPLSKHDSVQRRSDEVGLSSSTPPRHSPQRHAKRGGCNCGFQEQWGGMSQSADCYSFEPCGRLPGPHEHCTGEVLLAAGGGVFSEGLQLYCEACTATMFRISRVKHTQRQCFEYLASAA